MIISRRAGGWAAILAALNVVVCLVFTFAIFPSLQDQFGLVVSPDEYDDLAWNLAQGRGFRATHGEESVIRGPGYPALLALIYLLVGGHNVVAAQIAQCFLSGGVVFLTYMLARRLHNEGTGLLAAGLIAFHPLAIWYAPRLLMEIPFTFVCLIAFILADRLVEKPGVARAVAFGLSIAAASYIKSFAILFIVVAFLLLLIRRAGLARSFGLCAVAAAVAVLLIAPWTARNMAVTGRLIPVHSSLAMPLVCGDYYVRTAFQSPLSTGKSIQEALDAFPRITEEQGYPPINYYGGTRGSLREELIIEKAVLAHYVELYSRNPLYFFGSYPIRFVQFWYLSTSPLFSLAMLAINGLAIVLAITGWRALKGDTRRRLPVAFIIFFPIFHAAIIGQVRFTLPIQPLLLTLAAAGVLVLVDRLKPAKTGADSAPRT